MTGIRGSLKKNAPFSYDILTALSGKKKESFWESLIKVTPQTPDQEFQPQGRLLHLAYIAEQTEHEIILGNLWR